MNIKLLSGLTAVGIFLGISHASFAWTPNVNTLIDNNLKKEIHDFLANEVVITSIENQNIRYADLTQARIDELDALWMKQINAEDQYLIAAILSNPASAYLTRIQAHSVGKYVEIFVMDNKGLNVAQSSISSDFWQGDEDKWQKTYDASKGAVFVDKPEYNEKEKRWTVQYNTAITNAKGDNIGAATVEINLTEIARLKGISTNE